MIQVVTFVLFFCEHCRTQALRKGLLPRPIRRLDFTVCADKIRTLLHVLDFPALCNCYGTFWKYRCKSSSNLPEYCSIVNNTVIRTCVQAAPSEIFPNLDFSISLNLPKSFLRVAKRKSKLFKKTTLFYYVLTKSFLSTKKGKPFPDPKFHRTRHNSGTGFYPLETEISRFL